MICCRITLALFLCLSQIAASQTQPKPAGPASKPVGDAQLYRNTRFSFRFQIPYGWVDRTQEMREGEGAEKPDSPDRAATEEEAKKKDDSAGKGEVLLAIFERPPDAAGETVNSAVVIASESATAYPGLKKAEDYIGPLTELTTSKGFRVEGDPDMIEIDSCQLVRIDFTKALNETLSMHQSTLILLAKGQIISFTFIGGSEDEIDNLMEGLHFGAAKASTH